MVETELHKYGPGEIVELPLRGSENVENMLRVSTPLGLSEVF